VGEVVPVLLPRATPGHRDLALRFNEEMNLASDSRLLLPRVITVPSSGLVGCRNRVVHRPSRVPPRRVGFADHYGICLKHELSLLYLVLIPGI
jgi:hypothetical protein